ncbi:MAG: hypothetical protein LBH00_07480 [Planctomycetaceae bacterium]|jgi:phage gpG-like protein|nr:hypothetical protein [Planctomycetaceae bacterium]
MTFAEIYGKIRSAVGTLFRRSPAQELTPEEEERAAALWLKKQLEAYVLKSGGNAYNGKRWQPRKNEKDYNHPILIKSGRLYDAVRKSKIAVIRHKGGRIEFLAEVDVQRYPKSKSTTRDVFLAHQYGTPKMPARPIFTALDPKDQAELDEFVKKMLSGRKQAK